MSKIGQSTSTAQPTTTVRVSDSKPGTAPSKPHPLPNQLQKRHRIQVRLKLKRKKAYKISLHGDSISKGVIWDQEAGKYRVLADNYAELVSRRLKGNLLNRARFGMTLGRLMTKSIRDLDDLKPNERPDMVLVEYGGNDCDLDWEAIGKNPAGNHGPNTDPELFRELLRTLLLRFSDSGILPVLMTLPPLDADRYFAWVSRSSAEAANNILSFLGSVSRIYWWQERYNAAILEVAAQMGVHVLDVRSAFLHEPDYRTFLCMDGIHPNEAGHRLMAACVSEWLERFCGKILLQTSTRQA